MMKSLSSYSPVKKTLAMLEYSHHEGKPIFLGLELVQKKGELDIDQTFVVEHLQNISQFVRKQQLNLIITDDQVLLKEVSDTGTDADIVSEAFPNLNLNDFYYQILRTTKKSFIAVCRKIHVQTLIEQIEKTKIKVISVSLGALKMAALAEYAADEDLISYANKVVFDNGEVDFIIPENEKQEKQYRIEDLDFSSKYTLPLAVAMDLIVATSKVSGNLEIKNQELHKEYKGIRFFKNTLQIGIGFLLGTLLLNFFVFSSNYKKWQTLQEELQVYTTQKEQILIKQKEVETKENLVQSILTTGFSKGSFYIDQIVQVQPSTIILNSFTYQPLQKPVRKDKMIEIKQGIISISGESTDKGDFTVWLKTIEELEFIDNVTIIQYGLNKRNVSDFELTLSIKKDGTKD